MRNTLVADLPRRAPEVAAAASERTSWMTDDALAELRQAIHRVPGLNQRQRSILCDAAARSLTLVQVGGWGHGWGNRGRPRGRCVAG